MKPNLLLFTLAIGFSCVINAQLSDLHYLPPLRQGQNNGSIRDQAVYLSTPETTAFTVNAYRGTNTTPIATFSISNTTPAVYNLAQGNNNITLVDDANTGIVLNNSGLRFESSGGQPFYVNYRGNSAFQGASLTSKGRMALGTKFKWGGVPNLGSEVSKSNTLGIMATEDNTTVTLSGYDPDCEFRVGNDRAGMTDDSYTITLNENESFVFETYIGWSPTLAHERGWIGASIDADKAIVISNGSLNFGRQAWSSNRDAGIDQPVPENRLGKEYVFIRGNGNTNGWTEFPLIIATENNTQIFVNGSPTAIATINEGEFFEIPSSNYSGNTVGSNMYIETSEDVYAYQCMGGSTDAYTQGLNFVAPVSCLLPDTMDNIPNITDAAGITISGGVTIIAAATTPDSNITLTDGNGPVTLPASSSVAGTSNWKTFYIPNLTGDVSVQSTGPIAIGFFGYNVARGVAGYYSGFDTIPNIDLEITGTNCLPGAVLEISSGETFDDYQWYGNGVLIPEATSSSLPVNIVGEYYLRVTRGPCTYESNAISVYYCNPDIQLNKTANKLVIEEGETITFNITVQNFGVDPATNLVVTDALPTGVSLVSASPSVGVWSAPNWTLGTLNSGTIENIELIAIADSNSAPVQAQWIANIATNNQDQVDSNITTDSPSTAFIINNDFDTDGVNDIVDLDDDNDGILDCTESDSSITNESFGWNLNTPTGTLSMDRTSDPGINSWLLTSASDISFSGITANAPSSAIIISNIPSNTFEEAVANDDYIEVSFTTSNDLVNPTLDNIYWGWYQPIGGDSYTMSAKLSSDGFVSSITTREDLVITNNGNIYQVFNLLDTPSLALLSNTTYTFRVYIYAQNDDDGANYSVFDDLNFTISSCEGKDSDSDSVLDSYELDADNDFCFDSIEAYNDSNADGGDGGAYGTGTPPAINGDGTVSSASYATPNDADSNTIYDFIEASTPPTINTEATDQTIFIGNDGAFDLSDSDADEYQWEVSTDGGANFNAISDGVDYTGTQTNTLTLITPDLNKNGFIYRAILLNDTYICGQTISNEVTLTVGPRTVITNRRITFRVKKN